MTKYLIQSRNNQTLAVIDPNIETFEKFQARLKFNGMGTWALTLRRESQYAKTFISDSSGALNNGLLLFVDNEDGNPPVQLLSGPQDDYTMSRKEDSSGPLLVSGYSDEYWLQKRLTLTTPASYPYTTFWAAASGVVRFYALNESSGTAATDLSSAHINGSYNGAIMFSQPGMIDDPSTCTKINGGFVGVTTTSLPAGNSTISVFAWGMLTATPGFNTYVFSNGSNVANEGFAIFVDTSGNVNYGVIGKSTINGGLVSLNVPHLFGLTWDGTTLTAYLDGQSVGTQTPGAVNTVYGSCDFGIFVTGGGSWTGYLGMCGIANTLFNTNPTNMFSTMYLNGLSRQSFNSYDIPLAGMGTPSPLTASTMLIYYVQRNASTTASPYPAYGSALPATTFASFQGTRYARPVPNLVCAADPQVGSKVYAAGRFDPLLTLLPAIAIQSSPEVGFRLVQVGQQLQFQTYLPTDRTATAVFSLDRGNLRSYDWIYGRSSANYLFTGGLNASTSLTSRTFGEAGDATSIGQFGLIEDFYDYRKTNDTVTLANVMGAKLVQLRSKRNLNAVVNDTPGLYFAGPGVKGYNLGDRVTVITEDGQIFTDIVREVGIELTPGQPAKITPAIGSPIDAAIIGELDTIAKRFKDDGINIDIIQNNY